MVILEQKPGLYAFSVNGLVVTAWHNTLSQAILELSRWRAEVGYP